MKAPVFLLALATALPATADTGELEHFGEKGAELLQPFQQQLQSALQEGMQESVVEAIRVCQLEAPEIVERVTPEGVMMGRTSHRVRNPDNAPLEWQEEILTHYLDNPGNFEPMQKRIDDTRVAHAQPIRTESLCLSCHGTDLEQDVQAKLDELYPDDEATGFAAGDFRGIFWVTMPDDS